LTNNHFSGITREPTTSVHPIKLRKGDFFKDLAELINKAFLTKSDKNV
jgi:hypothetical protein